MAGGRAGFFQLWMRVMPLVRLARDLRLELLTTRVDIPTPAVFDEARCQRSFASLSSRFLLLQNSHALCYPVGLQRAHMRSPASCMANSRSSHARLEPCVSLTRRSCVQDGTIVRLPPYEMISQDCSSPLSAVPTARYTPLPALFKADSQRDYRIPRLRVKVRWPSSNSGRMPTFFACPWRRGNAGITP